MTWTSILCLALATASAPTGPAESRRVIFCTERAGVCATARPLGNLAGGFWAEATDAELLSSRSPLPPILYFTVEDHAHAMEGLDKREHEQAIARRHQLVAAHPETWVWQTLQDDLRALAATATKAHPQELALLVDAAAELRGSSERLRGATPSETLGRLRESLAALRIELPAGPLTATYEKEADNLSRLSQAPSHGSPQAGALAMPFAEREPVYFTPSVSEKQTRVLADNGQYPYRWRGGVVAVLSPRDLDRAPWKGQALRLVYVGRQPYLRDLLQLTRAQMNRRLQARARGISPNERAEFVAELAFDNAILFRSARPGLASAQMAALPAFLPQWQQVLTLDTENLAAALSAVPGASNRAVLLGQLRADLGLAAGILRGGPRADHTARIDHATKLLDGLTD